MICALKTTVWESKNGGNVKGFAICWGLTACNMPRSLDNFRPFLPNLKKRSQKVAMARSLQGDEVSLHFFLYILDLGKWEVFGRANESRRRTRSSLS